MMRTNKKAEIAESLRDLTATYVETLSHYERVLGILSRQIGLDEPVSLQVALGTKIGAMSPSSVERPYVDETTFCVVFRGKRCSLGNTLAYRLCEALVRQLNHYISYEQLLTDVWHVPMRSNEAIRNVAQILRKKLLLASLGELACAIDGRNRGHYGLILDRGR